MVISNLGRGIPLPPQTSKGPASTSEAGSKSEASAAKGSAAKASVSGYQASGASAGLQLEAGPPPVDMARVKSISATIAEGDYQVEPEQVATSLFNLESKLGSL